MSYIIGINTGEYVYLLADSAVTADPRMESVRSDLPQTDYTSFGELEVNTSSRRIYEGALKVINLGCAAVAFGGDIALCRSIVSTLKSALLLNNDPRSAFVSAISANGPYKHLTRQAKLLLAFPDSPYPQLLTYNVSGDRQISEVSDTFMVQFGSLKSSFASITPQMISNLDILKNEPHRFLVGCLAFLQSYGIHSYILEQGVGGVFCGLGVGERAVEWQKDILFCMHDGLDPDLKMVSSIVRDHVHVARSTITESCKYFGDSINDGLSESWRSKWWDQTFDLPSKGKFDFIVLLNTRFNIITVVEMLKQHEGNYLHISPSPPEGPDESFRLNLAFSPLLTKAMIEPIQNRHDGSFRVKFNWFPYDYA